MQNQANILIRKLDEFIRRYYKNQLIKGSIYASGILVAAFFTVVVLEYFGEFNSVMRGVLFFGFLGATLFVLSRYIVVPLLKLNRIGHIISYDQAALIIGNHFTNVQDKLLNVLQLQNNRMLNGSDELLLAGINQKISELSPVPFTTAVDLNENRKYLKYVLPLFLFTGTIFIIWPHVLSKSTNRLVNYETYFEKELPFKFSIANKKLQALQAEDYRLDIKVSGTEIPDEVFVDIKGIEYRMEKDDKLNFHYTFPNIQSGLKFQLAAAGHLSREYELEVLPRPTLLHFNLGLVYPAYTGKPNETVSNTGDLVLPQGTKVNWQFNTRNTDDLQLLFADSSAAPERDGADHFSFSRKFMQSNRYMIRARNKYVNDSPDSLSYNISVIPDQFPSIMVEEKPDSLNPRNVYFSGQVKDDYGFSRLTFHYRHYTTDSTGKTIEVAGSQPIHIAREQVSQTYFHFFDLSQFQLRQGDKVDYFFEVFDNDGVNGAKSSKTQMLSFKAPSREELNEMTAKSNSEITKDLEESIKKARDLQKEVNELAKKINDKNQLGYEEKKKMEDLLKKQNELQNKIEQIKQENELKNQRQNEFSESDENILEKQKQLEQLFENVMTPEMKKLFEELQKMMDKLDKNQVQEKLEELKLSNKDIEKELDRNLEAFKQLEVQQKMQEAVDKLDELQKKEQELAKKTEESAKDKESKGDKQQADEKNKELEKKQEEIAKEFNDLKKDLKELEEKNKALEEPNKMPSTEEKQSEVDQEMKKSSEQLSQKNKKAASQSQKNASQKMQEMKEQMEQAMQEEEEQQQEENAQALRQILENLLNLSFSQEELIKDLGKTRIDNPRYVDIPKQQNKLKDDSRIIEDSLLALSKRAPQISAIVNRGISSINMNMDKTVKLLAERNSGESTMRMQSTMKSVNDLALLLNESLEQMQQQMKQQQKQGEGKKGKCKKPGSGKGNNPNSDGPPASSMRKLQEQLNKQLQELKDAIEKGQKQGGQKPGDKPGDKPGQKPGGTQGQNGSQGLGMPGSSEQFAKMAAQQEALRRQMEQLMDKLKNKGRNPGGDIQNMMEQTEKELVNKQITNETMRRQQEILTRLLESEKAEKEREQDEQRKSNEAKNEILSNPEQFLEYKRLKEKEMELLNTVPPSLTPYYKEKVNNYFNKLEK